MRLRARKDRNQAQIQRDLEKLGFTTRDTSMIGGGFGDFIAGKLGVNLLFEVKDPEQPPSGRKMTDAELEFEASWKGQYRVIETTEDALAEFKRTAAREQIPF